MHDLMTSASTILTNQIVGRQIHCVYSLRLWASILNHMAEIDGKYNGMVQSAANMILLACAKIAQNLMNQAELVGHTRVSGTDEYASRKKAFDGIISPIVKDSPLR